MKGARDVRASSSAPLRAYPEVHAPRPEYTREPAWPRAGFGLPIVVHFQPKDREGNFYDPAEPEKVQLQWEDDKHEVKDRLASPLIVKALPLANGRFEPIALWLERRYPEKGGVVLMQRGKPLSGTRADFDRLHARGDRPLFWPLQREWGLREAFFEWLEDNRKARRA
jgi:CRISPR-associated protein Cmr1